MADEMPSLPTLRCPSCGHSDLLFRPSGEVRCGRCFKVWSRDELARTKGRVGLRWDQDVKEG